MPDERQCADWGSSNSTNSVTLEPGVVVCVATFGHRTARLTVVSTDTSNETAVVDAVIWSAS